VETPIISVVAELDEHGLRECALEIIGEGRSLADACNGTLTVLALSHTAGDWLETLRRQDADRVVVIEHPLLAEPTLDIHTAALAQWLAVQPPALLLMSDTVNGHEVAARLAAQLRWAVVTDCLWIKGNPQNGFSAIKPTHQDKVHTAFTCPPGQPLIATLRPGAIGVEMPRGSLTTEIIRWQPALDESLIHVRTVEVIPGDPRHIDLREAERIVAGGRGVRSAEDWHLIEELADALDAAVGGSRQALDLGYIPNERMIGQTGKSVKPRLYLAVGISGASHHLDGVNADALVAINRDRGAPIFSRCALGVVGDLYEILPALTRRIREMRETK
jgi:electron transfer flavoprotein alpha subunit